MPLNVVTALVEVMPRVMPGGSVPVPSAQVKGARPPDTDRPAPYELPTLAGNRIGALITGVPSTTSVPLADKVASATEVALMTGVAVPTTPEAGAA